MNEETSNPLRKVNPFAQALIATLLILGFFAVMLLPAVIPGFSVDEAMKQTLITLTILAIGFYFGTTSGSEKKTETIAQLARAANLTTPTEPVPVKIDTTDAPVAVTEKTVSEDEERMQAALRVLRSGKADIPTK